ncbi:MAG: helix-turn-helix transcriptional regulator [Clostridia bacterium]|nr:helix-turn-helix transcriptional regulator [Clostridia bacterium]
MISFAPFYETLKKKNISTYRLINQYGISRSLLDRIKHNKPMTTSTLNDLCNILDCEITDIVEFIKD